MARRTTAPDSVVPFAGLTTHNQVELGKKAQQASKPDYTGKLQTEFYPEDMPETSLATALRGLESATDTTSAWKVPTQIADRLSIDELAEEMPDSMDIVETKKGDIYVEQDRYPSVISPDKLERWVQKDFRAEDNNQFRDPLWNVPTQDYTIVNPMDFYGPLEQALRDQDLGDSVFGEIKTYKGGGEVHISMLFDAYSIGLGDDEEGGPILLGIRTGYDFFGQTQMYAEGFAQDTSCQNSMRNITEEKTRRHVGEPTETREWWDEILADMELMTDQLSELIEMANNIELDYMDMGFSDLRGEVHNDDLKAFYEVIGLPSYLAEHAASDAKARADNKWLPTMWDVHSGATYAITHHYRGGENTPRLDELIQVGNDLLMNPAQAITNAERQAEEWVERQRRAATGEDGEGGEGELDAFSFTATIEKFQESIADQREEFETKQEELRGMLVTVGGETADDGGN